MKKILLAFCFVLYTNFVYGQLSENIITFISPGYQVNSLNGFGFENNNLTTISNITNSNPSLITDLKPFSIGISKQFNSDIEDAWIANIGYKYIENWLPQSAGLVIPIGEFRLGLGLSQIYNAELDFGEIPITTVDQPDGTGELVKVTHKTTITSSSLAAAYPIKNILTNEDQLSIGGQFNLHFINHKNYIQEFGIESEFNDISWNAGINYKYSSVNTLIQLSLFYIQGFEFRNSGVLNGLPQVELDPEISRDQTYYKTILNEYFLTGFIPSKLSAGLLYQPNKEFIFTGNISNVFWNSYQENIHNQIEFSTNIVYKWNDFINTSAGIYLTDKVYFGDATKYFQLDNSATFLSIGAILNFYGLNIEASVADSHLFSNKLRKQTLLRFAIDFSL